MADETQPARLLLDHPRRSRRGFRLASTIDLEPSLNSTTEDLASTIIGLLLLPGLTAIVPAFIMEARRKKRDPHGLPYGWGYYVGTCWCMVSIGLLAMAAYILVSGDGNTSDALPLAVLFIGLAWIAWNIGYGVVHKLQWRSWIVATILSFNPVVWAINYFYGRNRKPEFKDQDSAGTAELTRERSIKGISMTPLAIGLNIVGFIWLAWTTIRYEVYMDSDIAMVLVVLVGQVCSTVVLVSSRGDRGWMALYFRRRALEEQVRIRDLEKLSGSDGVSSG